MAAFADDSIYVSNTLTNLLSVLITRPQPAVDLDAASLAHHEILASLLVSGNLFKFFACVWKAMNGGTL
ncbi:hypothetical protein BCR33DRAFT_780725 [Rhizoclosmatium globosum]|uniref:Uncharacterized protein n=1 Tax=Rhizoclosmatium globosum TaxID=329046 RepID=A0A1Y2CV97_9FUNG|nr:hypothetical protein BCR33DRAFT_780725 [Rhizoclosmatium globosum]|eukprot:ORY50816.1 hypothetical protein BCR33DRAFT_780725 [Rhizoclosmatium globosum]